MYTFIIFTKYLQHVLPFCSLQLKPRLDTALPTLSSGSEQEMEHDTQEEPEETGDQSPAPESTTSKGKSCTVMGRRIPSKSSSSSQKKTSTPVPVLDDTAEVGNLISSLQSQQERSDAIQGQITGLLSREQRSATAAWGTWVRGNDCKLGPDTSSEVLSCQLRHDVELCRGVPTTTNTSCRTAIRSHKLGRAAPSTASAAAAATDFLRWCPRHSYVGHHGTNSRTERRVHVDVGTASPSQYSRQLELQLSTAKYSGLQQFKHNAVSCGSTTR